MGKNLNNSKSYYSICAWINLIKTVSASRRLIKQMNNRCKCKNKNNVVVENPNVALAQIVSVHGKEWSSSTRIRSNNIMDEKF